MTNEIHEALRGRGTLLRAELVDRHLALILVRLNAPPDEYGQYVVWHCNLETKSTGGGDYAPTRDEAEAFWTKRMRGMRYEP